MDDIHKIKSDISNLQGKSMGCPNKSNPYHDCAQYCKSQWDEEDIVCLTRNLADIEFSNEQLENERFKILRKKIAFYKRKLLNSWKDCNIKISDGQDIMKNDYHFQPEDGSFEDKVTSDEDESSHEEDSIQEKYTPDEDFYPEQYFISSEILSMTEADVSQVEKEWNQEFCRENIKGMRPDVIPPHDKPGRCTNQLNYLKETVLEVAKKELMKCYERVDIQDDECLDPVKNPLNLTTIKLRLEYDYYNCAKECIKDFNTVFSNCYLYFNQIEVNASRNGNSRFEDSAHDIIHSVMVMENILLSKIAAMPELEVEVEKVYNKETLGTNEQCSKKPVPVQLSMIADQDSLFSVNSQKEKSLTLENLPEDETKLILSYLHKRDLKSLRLVSKRCSIWVIVFDKRMQKWHIDDEDSDEMYGALKISKLSEYFPFIRFRIYSTGEYDLPIRFIKTLKKDIDELDIFVHGSPYNTNFLKYICIPNLTKLKIQGGTEYNVLHNKSIAKTVNSITVRFSEEYEEYVVECVYPELQHLCLKECKMNFTWMISQTLESLIILDNCNIANFESLPRLPNLKLLMVDITSMKFIHKCADSIEFLIFVADDEYCVEFNYEFDYEKVDKLVCPKLKHLVFGDRCYPLLKFASKHKATLETLVICRMYSNEIYWQKKGNLVKEIINEFPLLQKLILPYKQKTVDKSGRVNIIWEDEEAVRVLKFICTTDYNVMEDEFINYVYPQLENAEDDSNYYDESDDFYDDCSSDIDGDD